MDRIEVEFAQVPTIVSAYKRAASIHFYVPVNSAQYAAVIDEVVYEYTDGTHTTGEPTTTIVEVTDLDAQTLQELTVLLESIYKVSLAKGATT